MTLKYESLKYVWPFSGIKEGKRLTRIKKHGE